MRGLFFSLVAFSACNFSKADTLSPFSDAIHCWQMGDELLESVGFSAVGEVEVGKKLSGDELTQSLQRGSDGTVAVLSGGALVSSIDDVFPRDAMDISLYLRFKADGPIDGTILYKGGKSDNSYAPFSLSSWYMPLANRFQMSLSAMVSVKKRELGLSRVAQGAAFGLKDESHSGWHDLVIRFLNQQSRNGTKSYQQVEVFFDGQLVDRRTAAFMRPWQPYYLNGKTPFKIGLDGDDRYPFKGMIDTVAVWERGLSDNEIKFLSGRNVDRASYQPELHKKERVVGGNIISHEGARDEHFKRLRERILKAKDWILENDPSFPRYHLFYPGGPFNDLLVFHKGRYHIFSTWMPSDSNYMSEGNDLLRWTHWVSDDLLSWRMLPFPVQNKGHNDNAAFYINEKGEALCYMYAAGTGEHYQPSLLISRDELLETWEWMEPADLPLENVPEELKERFDPGYVYKDGDWFYMTGSTRRPYRKGMPFIFPLYRSKDGIHWEYVKNFYEREDIQKSGTECAQVFPLGGKHVLTGIGRVSESGCCVVGEIKNNEFVVEKEVHLDGESLGYNCVYTLIDDTGRAVMSRWAKNKGVWRDFTRQGWSHGYSLPREVTLDPVLGLAFNPVEELKQLRGASFSGATGNLKSGEKRAFSGYKGAQCEVMIRVPVTESAGQVGVSFDGENDGISAYYDHKEKQLVIDLQRIQKRFSKASGRLYQIPLSLSPGTELNLRFFADRSMFEVYANGVCVSALTTLETPEQLVPSVFSSKGAAEITESTLWPMKSIFK